MFNIKQREKTSASASKALSYITVQRKDFELFVIFLESRKNVLYSKRLQMCSHSKLHHNELDFEDDDYTGTNDFENCAFWCDRELPDLSDDFLVQLMV